MPFSCITGSSTSQLFSSVPYFKRAVLLWMKYARTIHSVHAFNRGVSLGLGQNIMKSIIMYPPFFKKKKHEGRQSDARTALLRVIH